MKLRVLVFDDDPAVCAILGLLLERYGCEVMTYANPSMCPLVASELCRCGSGRSYADLIISDLEMPEMSGLDLVGRLDENGCKVPHVMLISGMWSNRELAVARQRDCHVMHKPFTVGTLYAWVDECARSIDPNRVLCPVTTETGPVNRSDF
jgi:CheY-like chemotaxis protein